MNASRFAWLLAWLLALSACGGSGGNGAPPVTTPTPPAPEPPPPGLVSTASPFAAACGLGDGAVHINAEVEPHLAVNPRNASHVVAVWQQDRWSNGAARGNRTAVSFDGGATWTFRELPFSRCAGGAFDRATDPWVAFGPDGTVHQMALGTTGGVFADGSQSAMLVSRSTDGGLTWSPPFALISDTRPFFNDKNTLTADPYDPRYVYAAWDRLSEGGSGPAWFARSSDAGLTWDLVHAVFDPGGQSQTIGGLVTVLPGPNLAYLFTRIDPGPGNTESAALFVMRSTDRGATWSAPARVAALLARGARDPETGTAIRDGSILAQMAAAPDGSLLVVWQDSRFTGGARDGIALSRSGDGGLTWSPPVRVNSDPSVEAFTPQIAVRSDGTIGVTYFDLRSNTTSFSELGTDYWLARSADAVSWSEARVAGPFNLNTAPFAGGYFLGDYMGLAAAGTNFLALYTLTRGDAANATDVFFTQMAAAPGLAAPGPEAKRAAGAAEFVPDAQLRARVSDNIARALRARGRPAPRPEGAAPR